MKFLIRWTPIETKKIEGLQMFATVDMEQMQGHMANMGIETEVSYHLTDQSGFSVVSANNIQTVTQFCLLWSGTNNIQVDPIMTDEEMQAAAKGTLAMMAEMGG